MAKRCTKYSVSMFKRGIYLLTNNQSGKFVYASRTKNRAEAARTALCAGRMAEYRRITATGWVNDSTLRKIFGYGG